MAESAPTGVFDSIAAFLEELESEAYPGGGIVAALSAALAASLVAMAADRSRPGWDEAGGARAQAQALRRRAIELAERNAAAFAAARDALAERQRDVAHESATEDQAARDWRLGVAVEQAAGPPLELAAAAADVAELAASIAARGAAEVRPDAAIAAVLAAAATRAAAQLVEINLVVGQGEESIRARAYAEAAAAAAAAAAGAEIG
jgi:formiminotetrahydrofolate cyclodeaminase